MNEFQIHAPNDYKLRCFQAFVCQHEPQAEFDLYFEVAEDCGRIETECVRRYRPLINDRIPVELATRIRVEKAFSQYYTEAFESRLTDE